MRVNPVSAVIKLYFLLQSRFDNYTIKRKKKKHEEFSDIIKNKKTFAEFKILK